MANPLETYIYDLPFSVTREIIQSLDSDKAWEKLASEAGYSFDKIKLFELEYQRYNGSPTKALLWDLGSRNVTTRDLYFKLKKINRQRELNLLRKYFLSVRAEVSRDLQTHEDNSDNVISLISPSELPRPSQKHKIKTERVAKAEKVTNMENDEVNFNQPSPQVIGSKKHLQRSSSSVEKYKHYDDKIIPGQEKSFTAFHSHKKFVNNNQTLMKNKSQDSQSSFLKVDTCSKPTESSDSLFDISSCSQTEDLHNLKDLLSSENLPVNVAVALIGSPLFTYTELSKSTNEFSFKNKIGEGAFGKVYLSVLRGSKCAVKIINSETKDTSISSKETKQQLCSELSSLLRYRHENIVTLYGYAVDGPSLCLVYQHMVNGSLADCLQCINGRSALSWDKRIRILHGAASGLRYLHYMGNIPLIHGDIKSANILLDKYFEAKLGDLGQSQHVNNGTVTGKLTHITKKDGNAKLYGTKAYLPPEFLRGNENMSIKTDIYAFGVVILETMSGEPAYSETRPVIKFLTEHFMDCVQPLIEDKWVEIFCDKKCGKAPSHILVSIIKTAVSCVSEIKKKRPDTHMVVEELERAEEIWNQNHGSFSECQNSAINYSHLTHSSGIKTNVENMDGNISHVDMSRPTSDVTPESGRSYSPIDYFRDGQQSLPEPFRLQILYDKKLESSDISQIPEETKELHKKNKELYSKSVSKIYKNDNISNISQDESNEPDIACDPQKLAQLKLFDTGGMIHPDSEDKASDNHKLKAILEFDHENFANLETSQQSEETESTNDMKLDSTNEETSRSISADTKLKNKMEYLFKLYKAGYDEDVDDEYSRGSDQEIENKIDIRPK